MDDGNKHGIASEKTPPKLTSNGSHTPNKVPAKDSLKKIMGKITADRDKYVGILQEIDAILVSLIQN
jgi:hypothetical protein